MTRVVLCVQNMPVPDDPRVWNEATTLAEAGYAVTVVSPSGPGAACEERLDGIDIVRYRTARERSGVAGQVLETVCGFVGTARAVARLRRRGPIAVLHVANPPDTLFPLAWWLGRSGTRFVYDQHDPTPELLEAKLGHRPLLDRVLRLLERRTYAAADLVIVGNNSCRRLALERSGHSPDRVITIRLGPRAIEAPAESPPRVPLVTYAGVMGVQDSVDVLLEAFATVLRRRPGSARLELIGRGDSVSMLKQRIEELGIGEAVSWAGWLPRTEMRQRLSRATVGVSPDVDNPNTRVSTMIKVSEYLSLGLPAVVADLPENRVTAGEGATYFHPGDAADLADRLAEVLFDESRRAQMAEAARRRAPGVLWEHSAPRLLAAYRNLLDGGPSIPGDQHVPDAYVPVAS
jgi:glycosyltransferase involved in cell wall biosynthesis